MRIAAAFAALALVGACEPPVEPIGAGANRVLVHAVLDLGANEQLVLLERTQPSSGGFVAINGATVTLTAPGGIDYVAIPASNTLSQQEPFAPAVYRLLVNRFSSPGFVAGGRFSLRVVIGTDTITGTTTMPQAQAATSSQSPVAFRRLSDTLRLQWPRVPGARGYQVGIYTTQNGGPAFRQRYVTFTDTAVAIPGTAEDIENGSDAFPLNERVTVVVAAVDDNFHAYYRATSGPFTGSPPSRLTGGALGVFGSIVPILIRSYDVR